MAYFCKRADIYNDLPFFLVTQRPSISNCKFSQPFFLFPFFLDLQFSTDDEEFEEVVADFDTTAAVLGQGEGLARSAQPINYLPGCIRSKIVYLLKSNNLKKI